MPKVQARIYLTDSRTGQEEKDMDSNGFYVKFPHKRKNHERTFMWRVSMKPTWLGTPAVGNFLKRQG